MTWRSRKSCTAASTASSTPATHGLSAYAPAEYATTINKKNPVGESEDPYASASPENTMSVNASTANGRKRRH